MNSGSERIFDSREITITKYDEAKVFTVNPQGNSSLYVWVVYSHWYGNAYRKENEFGGEVKPGKKYLIEVNTIQSSGWPYCNIYQQ